MRSEAEAAVSEQFDNLEAFKFSTAVARVSVARSRASSLH